MLLDVEKDYVQCGFCVQQESRLFNARPVLSVRILPHRGLLVAEIKWEENHGWRLFIEEFTALNDHQLKQLADVVYRMNLNYRTDKVPS